MINNNKYCDNTKINLNFSENLLKEISDENFWNIEHITNSITTTSKEYIEKQINFEYDVRKLICYAKDMYSQYNNNKGKANLLTGTKNNNIEGMSSSSLYDNNNTTKSPIGHRLVQTKNIDEDQEIQNYIVNVIETYSAKCLTPIKEFANKNTNTCNSKVSLSNEPNKRSVTPLKQIEIKKHSCIKVNVGKNKKLPRKSSKHGAMARPNIPVFINNLPIKEQQQSNDRIVSTQRPQSTQTESSVIEEKKLENITLQEIMQLANDLKINNLQRSTASIKTQKHSSIQTAPTTGGEDEINAQHLPISSISIQKLPPLNISVPLKIQSVHKIEISPSKENCIDEDINNKFYHVIYDKDSNSSLNLKNYEPTTSYDKNFVHVPKKVNRYVEPFLNNRNKEKGNEFEIAVNNFSNNLNISSSFESDLTDNLPIKNNTFPSGSDLHSPNSCTTDDRNLLFDWKLFGNDSKIFATSPAKWINLIDDAFETTTFSDTEEHDEDEEEQSIESDRLVIYTPKTISSVENKVQSKTPSPIYVYDEENLEISCENDSRHSAEMPKNETTFGAPVSVTVTENCTQTQTQIEIINPNQTLDTKKCNCEHCCYHVNTSCCLNSKPSITYHQYVPPLDLSIIKSMQSEIDHKHISKSASTSSKSSSSRSSSNKSDDKQSLKLSPKQNNSSLLPSQRYKTLKKSLNVPLLEQNPNYTKTLNSILATANKYKNQDEDLLQNNNNIISSYQDDPMIQYAAEKFLQSIERDKLKKSMMPNEEEESIEQNLASSSSTTTTFDKHSNKIIDYFCTNSEDSNSECLEEVASDDGSHGQLSIPSLSSNRMSTNCECNDSSIEYHIRRLKEFGIESSQTSLLSGKFVEKHQK